LEKLKFKTALSFYYVSDTRFVKAGCKFYGWNPYIWHIMKSTEHYLTIFLNKTILSSPANKILICDYSNERYAEQYFPTVLFVPLQHVVLSLNRSYWAVVLGDSNFLDRIKCDHSNESYWAVLPFGTVYYAVQDSFNFYSVDEIGLVWLFK